MPVLAPEVAGTHARADAPGAEHGSWVRLLRCGDELVCTGHQILDAEVEDLGVIESFHG